MEREQIRQLFLAFATGYFCNNFVTPKATETPDWTKKLKRLFRSYGIVAYGEDFILSPAVDVDDWAIWVYDTITIEFK